MLSLLHSPFGLLLTVAGVGVASASGISLAQQLFAAFLALVSLGFAVGLAVGGIMLLTRRPAGRAVLVASWAVDLLVGIGSIGLTWTVAPRNGDGTWFFWLVTIVCSVVGIMAAITIALTLRPSTKRWCQARQPIAARLGRG
ncbi:hypothetical protein BKN37_11550 [Mycobacterium talmoniae]|uniref:Uncharacterized protein n=1 Tax=Mycobacterium talmoniae TaxID=1858794 RepID=A0A1S1NLP6_9MYCO|nr:hypothetical protein BKN37_11550 [Mycobacterium talmoniae]